MEVFSIITSNKQIKFYFEEFIYSYSKLQLKYKDVDTSYFINILTGKNEIYYHYRLVDKDEYEYNYSESEKNFIKDYFKDQEIFIFDLQFKNALFIKELLYDFKNFVKKNYIFSDQKNEIKVLYSDSENGVSEW